MSNVENIARYVEKEDKIWVELIVSAHLLERISQVASTQEHFAYLQVFCENHPLLLNGRATLTGG